MFQTVCVKLVCTLQAGEEGVASHNVATPALNMKLIRVHIVVGSFGNACIILGKTNCELV